MGWRGCHCMRGWRVWEGKAVTIKQETGAPEDACLQFEEEKVLCASGDCFRSDRRCRLFFAVRLLTRLLASLADVNSALEERAVFNRDARGHDIACERTVAANINSITGGQVAADFAEHDNLARVDVGGDHAVAPNRDAVPGKVNRAFHAPVNVQ